jgi:hypothetical protein
VKSFSPAGMAIKAYFGLGARTFGNPDGALKGGGAYAAGGNNPNGPNQGGGGATPNLIIRSNAVPQIADVAGGGAPADQILGDFSTIIGLISGLLFQLFDAGPNFEMRAFCTVTQFGFTSIQLINTAQTFKSVDAVFTPGCGSNTWVWAGRAQGILPATVYNMLVTP